MCSNQGLGEGLLGALNGKQGILPTGEGLPKGKVTMGGGQTQTLPGNDDDDDKNKSS